MQVVFALPFNQEKEYVFGENQTSEFTFLDANFGTENNDFDVVGSGLQIDTSKGVQVTQSLSGVKCTTKSSFDNISKIEINYYTTSKGKGSIKVDIGTSYTDTQSVTTATTTSNTLTYTPNSIDGKFSFTVTCTTNSIYINSITLYHNGVISNSSSTSDNNPTTPVQDENYYPISYTGTYYNNYVTSGQKGESLLTSLHNRISTGSIVYKDSRTSGSDRGYASLWYAYETTDVYPNTKQIWDMYSNPSKRTFTYATNQEGKTNAVAPYYNREHTIPQSWFNKEEPMVCDIHHVYPTDKEINNERSNDPHGNIINYDSTSFMADYSGCKIGTSVYTVPGSRQTVCEVPDEYKGDFARTYLYFACRYMDQLQSFINLGKGADKVYKGSFPYITDFSINTYIQWAKDDPVSQKEIDRNNAVYALQGNRNPFIDHQTWIFDIWDQDYEYTTNITPVTPVDPVDPVVDPITLDESEYVACGAELESLDTKSKLYVEYKIKGSTVTVKNAIINYTLSLNNTLNYDEYLSSNVKLCKVLGKYTLEDFKESRIDPESNTVEYVKQDKEDSKYLSYSNSLTNNLTTTYTAVYYIKLGDAYYYSKPTSYSVRTIAGTLLSLSKSSSYAEHQTKLLNYLKGL